jgi:hypothetical protein
MKLFGKETKRNKNDWWDAGREGMLKQKNEVRGKWKVRNTRTNTESYLQKRKEARKYFKAVWSNL